MSDLAKRIIPCLDIVNGNVAKGIKFEAVKAIGDPIELAVYYQNEGADELVFYDINATVEMRSTFINLVERIAETIKIPFTVGGGIRTVDDIYNALLSGADKVSVNSAAILNPEIIYQGAKRFGNQCMVASMDVGKLGEDYFVYTHGGKNRTTYNAIDWVKRCEELGAGELVINAIDQDGVKKGYDLALMQQIREVVNIPIIASGGAGNMKDFEELFELDAADGAIAASIFHYKTLAIPSLKSRLSRSGIVIREVM